MEKNRGRVKGDGDEKCDECQLDKQRMGSQVDIRWRESYTDK